MRERLDNPRAEELALAHDRTLYPRQTHNHRGQPVFDLSPAKQRLQEDVKNNLHTTMSSSELQATRPEYRNLNPNKFKDRIPQEVRRQKFLHYLELERSKKFMDRKLRGGTDLRGGTKDDDNDNMDDNMDEL